MKAEPITILIADDHPIYRQGLRQIIMADGALHVVAEADDGASALLQLRKLKPRIAVLDVEMPHKDGFALAREVRAQNLPIELIFLTMYRDEQFFNAALDLGVKGYLVKDSAPTEVIRAIKVVATGESFFSQSLTKLLHKRASRLSELMVEAPGLGLLTMAERRVLKHVAEGLTSKQIADELGISARTVEHHRAHIANKLDLKGSHALLQFALKHQTYL
ncbi:MAG: response regulator transcription factor [Acidobacteria bacterium]|nr:response regulator transcription factor [Acidobacteriota bacterium]